MINNVSLQLRDDDGRPTGLLHIGCLPKHSGQGAARRYPELLLDRSGEDPSQLFAQAPIQLLEEAEYTYLLKLERSRPVDTEPRELFDRSMPDGLSGRLRTGRATGTVRVIVSQEDGQLLGKCEFEVRSRKLGYLSEYRWMLQRIADEAAEMLLAQFAPSTLGAFRPATMGSAQALYQRFAFIQSLLTADEFQASLEIVTRRPHQDYLQIEELADPAHGMKASRQLISQLTRSGPRRVVLAPTALPLDTLPTAVIRIGHEETYDTVPNRFVRFVLEYWRDLVDDVASRCSLEKGPTGARAVRETSILRNRLDVSLASPVLTAASPLATIPVGSTILQRRAGYRDVFRAFLQAEAAALIDWQSDDDLFSAGQRNVATLYEYWVYLELARIIASSPGLELDRRPILKKSNDGLTLDLQRGRESVLRGAGHMRGAHLAIELWFNRQFKGGTGSWTESMRPDCSLHIRRIDTAQPDPGTWLHFDAKYRVDSYLDVFVDGPSAEESPAPSTRLKPKSDDLLKMHAYRDAIRRTSGAFVLYPGGDEQAALFPEFHEILPGLGAFVLRPTETGRAHAASAQALRQFVEDVVDHVASAGTDEERARYWADLTYREKRGRRLPAEVALPLPPADTRVLLGFVKSPEHWEWIERTGLYNLRADPSRMGSVGLTSPELGADLLCLYDEISELVQVRVLDGRFLLRTASELAADGYPTPGGKLYCCLALGTAVRADLITASDLRRFARADRPRDQRASPRATTWIALLANR